MNANSKYIYISFIFLEFILLKKFLEKLLKKMPKYKYVPIIKVHYFTRNVILTIKLTQSLIISAT